MIAHRRAATGVGELHQSLPSAYKLELPFPPLYNKEDDKATRYENVVPLRILSSMVEIAESVVARKANWELTAFDAKTDLLARPSRRSAKLCEFDPSNIL